ncbi:MAG: acetyl-CoA carboxylase biotin carboxyl carrier protein [Pseudobutyrivibrio sp.]|nr:acetyl-CoA carboxylase biotin carboxyl carrier protein [Pseudobutyrivibrio sp.]
MEIKEVKELLKAFDESESTYLSIEQEGVKIKLKKQCEMPRLSYVESPVLPQIEIPQNKEDVASATNEAKEEPVDGQQVLAPLVGVFYAAPSPEASAYVQVGDKVKAGQILCLIEAMKMMSEITAPRDGIIKKIYAKNQDVVEYEQPLFLIGD